MTMEDKSQHGKTGEDKTGGKDAVAEDSDSIRTTVSTPSSTGKGTTIKRAVDQEEPSNNGGESAHAKGDNEVAVEAERGSKETLVERQAEGDTVEKDMRPGGEKNTAPKEVDQGGGTDRADEHVPNNIDVKGGT